METLGWSYSQNALELLLGGAADGDVDLVLVVLRWRRI